MGEIGDMPYTEFCEWLIYIKLGEQETFQDGLEQSAAANIKAAAIDLRRKK